MDAATGLTKDTGWQLGVRRTMPTTVHLAWAALLAEVGVDSPPVGVDFETADGIRGEVRSLLPNELIRMTWQPRGEAETTLQLRVIPAATGTTIAVHQDRVTSAAQRARLLEHWSGVLDRLRATLEK